MVGLALAYVGLPLALVLAGCVPPVVTADKASVLFVVVGVAIAEDVTRYSRTFLYPQHAPLGQIADSAQPQCACPN